LLGNEAATITATEESALLQSQRILRTDAVQSAVYKDIPQAFGVDSPLMLERLLYTLAGQATNILSPNKICGNLDRMSQPTFDRYLSYLEKAFLVFTLPNYSGSEASVQKRGRKLYFVDGAVRNAALQRGLAPLNDPAEMGVLVENMIAGHLYALSQQTQVRLYHWRDKDDEVDLVYDHPDSPMAFEISTGHQHHRYGLVKFAERHKRFHGRCFLISPHPGCQMPQPGTLNEVGTIPLDLFLLAVSAQAEKELENNLLSAHRQA
jgi:predicted AAA+ superfamily ATPase